MATAQQKLVNSIVAPVEEVIQKAEERIKAEISVELADLKVQVAAVGAQLAVLEVLASKGSGSKRAPRGARKTAATGKVAGKDSDVYAKVKNGLLFTRRMVADDEEFRAEYLTPEVLGRLKDNERLSKFTEGTEDYYLTAGAVLWSKIFTARQKDEVRAKFQLWRDARRLSQIEPPLAEDTGAPAPTAAVPAPTAAVPAPTAAAPAPTAVAPAPTSAAPTPTAAAPAPGTVTATDM